MSCKWTSSTSRWADHLWSAFGRLSVSVNRRGQVLHSRMRWLKFSSINFKDPRYFSHHRGEVRVKMEKITDKIAALPPNENYFSLEFFPPKTQMVGYPRTLLTFLKTRPVTNDDLNIVGLFQSTGPFRAHVTSTTSLVRYRHLGSRWKHGR